MRESIEKTAKNLKIDCQKKEKPKEQMIKLEKVGIKEKQQNLDGKGKSIKTIYTAKTKIK